MYTLKKQKSFLASRWDQRLDLVTWPCQLQAGGGGGGGWLDANDFCQDFSFSEIRRHFSGAGLFSWSRNQFDKSDSDLLIKKESHNRTNCLMLKCFKFFVVVIVQKGFLSYEIKIQKFCGSGSVFDAGQESKSYPRQQYHTAGSCSELFYMRLEKTACKGRIHRRAGSQESR